jgi:phage tail-like protein
MTGAQRLQTAGRKLEGLTGQVGMSHRYVIEIDESAYRLGGWSKAAGLGVSWQPLRYRAGNSTTETIVPGAMAYQNISLSRAAGADSAIVKDWLASVSVGRQPMSGAIYLVDFAGMPVVDWELREFFPISWRLTEFDSTGSRPAIETLELAHTGFLRTEAKG